VLLAAVLLKMGTYGIVRLVVATVPNGLATLSPVLAILGVVGILWGGLACLVERDLKRLIAYSSVAHMGFVVLALASGSDTGLQAALLGNIAHGMVAALLFFVVGDLKEQWGSADLRTVRIGLRDRASRFGVVLLIGLGAALGLPGLVSFWGEFLALYATWSPAADRPVTLMRICVVLGAAGLALAAAYSLRVARLVWSGEAGGAAAVGAATPVTGTLLATGVTGAMEAGPGPEIAPEAGGVVDVRGARWAVMLTLAVAVVVLGVLPQLLLGLSGADAVRLITGVGVP
jgi:NADH-quinone oxidoreductase subunit M